MAYNERSPRNQQAPQAEQQPERKSLPAVNRVTLVGNVGRDREMHATKDGRPFATFSVATAESWLDPETRERRERTDWHKVGVYRKGLVSLAQGWLGKGSRVYIEGQLRNNIWTDEHGKDHTDTEVAVTSRKGEMIIFSAKPPAQETPGPGQNRARQPRSEDTRQTDARRGAWPATRGATSPRTTSYRRNP